MKTKFLNKIISILCAATVSTTIAPSVGAIKNIARNNALSDQVKRVDEKIILLRESLNVYAGKETLEEEISKVDQLLKETENLNISDDNKLFLSSLEKSVDPLTELLGSPFIRDMEEFNKLAKLELQICQNKLKKLKENTNDCDIAVRMGFEDAIKLNPQQNFNDNILKEYQKYYDAGYASGSVDIYSEKLKPLINKIYYSNDPIDEKMKNIAKILELRKDDNHVEKAKVIIDVINPLFEQEDRHQREALKNALVECIKTYIDEDMKIYENVESAANLVKYIQIYAKNDLADRIAEAVITSTFKDKFDSVGKLESLINEQLSYEKENFKAYINKNDALKIYEHELNYVAFVIKDTLKNHNDDDTREILFNRISGLSEKFNQSFRRFANISTGENTNIESILKDFDFNDQNVQNVQMDEIDYLNDVLKNHPQLEKIRDSFSQIVDEIAGINVDESKPFNERILAAAEEFEKTLNSYVNSLN